MKKIIGLSIILAAVALFLVVQSEELLAQTPITETTITTTNTYDFVKVVKGFGFRAYFDDSGEPTFRWMAQFYDSSTNKLAVGDQEHLPLVRTKQQYFVMATNAYPELSGYTMNQYYAAWNAMLKDASVAELEAQQ